MAHRTGALATRDLERVVVDTTVQPKNVTFPTDVTNMTVSARAILRLQSQADAGLASMRMLITTKAIRP